MLQCITVPPEIPPAFASDEVTQVGCEEGAGSWRWAVSCPGCWRWQFKPSTEYPTSDDAQWAPSQPALLPQGCRGRHRGSGSLVPRHWASITRNPWPSLSDRWAYEGRSEAWGKGPQSTTSLQSQSPRLKWPTQDGHGKANLGWAPRSRQLWPTCWVRPGSLHCLQGENLQPRDMPSLQTQHEDAQLSDSHGQGQSGRPDSECALSSILSHLLSAGGRRPPLRILKLYMRITSGNKQAPCWSLCLLPSSHFRLRCSITHIPETYPAMLIRHKPRMSETQW